MVFAAAVVYVYYRILLIVLVIAGRHIDLKGSPFAGKLGLVVYKSHVSVGNILDFKEFRARFRYFHGNCHSAASIEGLAHRIGETRSVNLKEIVVESRHERLGGDSPESVHVLFHRVFHRADVGNHAGCSVCPD